MPKQNPTPPIPDWAKPIAKKIGWKKGDSTGHQGGFSDEVYHSKPVQDYFRDMWPLKGYIGARTRTVARDKALEKELRETFKLTPSKIGTFLVSVDGRWLAERLSNGDISVKSAVKGSYFERGFQSLKRSRS